MNHIYKVIWNKAKHCYTVVSEIAKSHSDSTKRVRTGTMAALLAVVALTGMAMPVEAAVTVDTDGTVKAEAADISALNDLLKNGVTTNKDGSVTVGGMTVKKNGEVSSESQHIVYGKGAQIKSDISPSQARGFISIGDNATTWIGGGGQEKSFAYDGKVEHAAGAIAIGSNTFARTGSIMIGSHEYKGNMGDVKNIDTDVFNTGEDGAYGHTVNSTTIGTNSFTKGNLATTIGDYNIQSGRTMGYNDWKNWNLSSTIYGAQNFGATVLGALNSNESQSATIDGYRTSGVANSIVGVANRVNSSNGTLVFGAGNEVTNSLSNVYGVSDSTSLQDAKKAQDTFKNAVAQSDGGGAVLAVGGANKADWAQKSQLIGVGNTLTGTEKNVSKYDMINGYKNEVSNATNTYIVGSNNKAKDTKSTTITGDNNDVTANGNHIIGDNHKVTGANNILIGNNKEQKTHAGNDAVIIGNNASGGNTSLVIGNQAHAGNTGIALGMNASAGDGQNLAVGYYANVSGAKNSTALGYASQVTKRDILDVDGNDGVVSVGKSTGLSGEAGITRRIINVKAGVNDTDAVNVSQLKNVENIANKGWNLSTGNVATNATNVAPGDYVDFSGDKNISVSHDGTNVKVALNKDIDVNSVQTNALNAKYNLSVGTMGTDGKTGFFVNSNGAFYGAKGNFVVDKDGGVTAASGDIGNVKLKNGVYYKNTALRDGELYVGDADGNYSQITSKNAKLGKVTIDNQGNVAGVNGLNANSINSKYNLSVGTMGADGKTGFFVNSNGAFYGAKGNFIVDKDGGVTATNGTIGNVILKNGVYYKNTALRDGELYVGDAEGNYSQVTSKNAKLGKVTIDETGRISGVAAGRIAADSTDAINGSQLHAVQQEAGKHTKVVNGSNISVEEIDNDGQKTYKVGLNKDILLGDITGKNVSISGTNGTIETTGFIATKDRVYADKGAKLADVDITGDVISNGPSKVVLNEGYAGMAYGDTSIALMPDTVLLNGKVTVGKDGKISGVAAGRVAADSTDAINGSQLHAVQQEAGKHTKVVNGSNISVEEIDNDGQKTYKVGLNKDILLGDVTGKNVSISGSNGTIETTGNIITNSRVIADKGAKLADVDITGDVISNGLSSIRMGGNGGTVTINNVVTIDQTGKISGVADGAINEKSKDAINGSQLAAVKKDVAQNATDIKKNAEDIKTNADNIQKNTASIKENADNIKQNADKIQANADAIAKNTEAIQKNTADIEQNKQDIASNKENISKNTEAIGKLDERVTSVEEVAKKHSTVSTDDENIQVTEGTNAQGGKDYKVGLNKDLKLDSVTTGDTKMDTNGVKVGDTVSITKDGLTAGDTKVTGDGLSISDKTYVSKDGLNANDQKVTNVAAGEISSTSTDAINGSQLFATNQQVAQNAQSINKLGNRINKVGAGAAALAALHPLDFDPDDKWDFAAGYGNYNGENAAAIGAYYRPNEDTMFSVGGSFGNGENMVNAGISLKLGQGNHVSTSKVAMAKEIKDLRKELETLKSAMLDVNAGKKLDISKLQLFPDVPQNHWAYEYVSQLKGNGILTGYPDGEFKGDRPMTRYEFAAMLYKAMLEGATLSDKILTEFAPELERFTVDTVHADKDGKPVVERVRTVKR